MLGLAVAVCVYLVVAVILVARLRPSYSHRRDTISELSEHGALYYRLTGLGVFLPVGLGLWLISWLSHGDNADLSLLTASLGAGYVIGALFPCDYGLPRHGSWRQRVHNAGGLVEYVGSAYALFRLAPEQGSLAPLFYVAVLFAPLATATAFVTPLRPVRGLVQRISESLLFGLMIWAVAGTDS